MEENYDDADILTQQEEEVLETSNEDVVEEDEFDWKAEAEKAKELANNYKIRAEKAERAAKSVKTEVPKQTPIGEMSTSDMYALIQNNVPQEDINEVKEYANLKGLSIQEALNSNFVKNILKDNAEMRNSAKVANVGGSRRVSGTVTDDALLTKFSKGDMPDNDDDLRRMIKARKGIK